MTTVEEMAREAGNDSLFDEMQIEFLERLVELARADEREALAAPVQQAQVCPQKICWTPYECENGRCTGAEKNEPVGRFNGKFRAGDGKMFFEVEVAHDKALPAVFSFIYTSPPPQRKPLTDKQRTEILKDNTIQGYQGEYFDAWGIIDDVEAAHGIKENT